MAADADRTLNELRDLDRKLSLGDSEEEDSQIYRDPHKPLRTKADFKPEALFVGQILGADGFELNDAIFWEAIFQHGDKWEMLSTPPPIQTHSCYPDDEGAYVFSHPFEFYMTTGSIFGWPKFIIKVYRLDDFGKIDAIAYGSVILPNQPGSFELEWPTWRPLGNSFDEAYTFFLGGPPKLTTLNPLTRDLKLRENICTISSGTIYVQCDVILKAFDELGIITS